MNQYPLRVVLVLLTMLAVGAPSASCAPPRPRSFGEFLTSSQDLVVVGTVLSATEVRRGYEESCGTTGLMPLPMTVVQLRVDQVLAGVAPDTTIEFLALDQGYFPDGHPEGQRVIAWGIRSCDDGWRIRGRLGVIAADGHVVGSNKRPVFYQNEGGAEDVTLSNLLVSTKLENSSTALYERANGLALVRRTDHSGWTPTGATFTVELVEWVAGVESKVPKFVSFAAWPGCFPDIYPGDSLLIPVSSSFLGDTLTVDRCPTSLRVQAGYVPGLGVRLHDLRQALRLESSVFRVRSVLDKGSER